MGHTHRLVGQQPDTIMLIVGLASCGQDADTPLRMGGSFWRIPAESQTLDERRAGSTNGDGYTPACVEPRLGRRNITHRTSDDARMARGPSQVVLMHISRAHLARCMPPMVQIGLTLRATQQNNLNTWCGGALFGVKTAVCSVESGLVWYDPRFWACASPAAVCTCGPATGAGQVKYFPSMDAKRDKKHDVPKRPPSVMARGATNIGQRKVAQLARPILTLRTCSAQHLRNKRSATPSTDRRYPTIGQLVRARTRPKALESV